MATNLNNASDKAAELGPWPDVHDRSFWYHDAQRGQYWARSPFMYLTKRAPKAWAHALIKNVRQLKETLRAGDTTDVGGYPLYLVTQDGGALHYQCAKEQFRELVDAMNPEYRNSSWKVIGCEINHEDHHLYCDHCNERIEASYEIEAEEE